MKSIEIRPYRSPSDAERQYELWLRATESLTRAWRSCLRNVRHQLRAVEQFPACRLYAETETGELRGYIGIHPPFEWIGGKHGPPDRDLGWTIPFGFPWTDPLDEPLADRLYEAMVNTVRESFPADQRGLWIQRFRESWEWPISFLRERGWRLIERAPLMGRAVASDTPSPPLARITDSDLPFVQNLTEADDLQPSWSLPEVQARFEGGWIAPEQFWRVDDFGVFALEKRNRWAAVPVLLASDEHREATLHAALAQAASLGCEEAYFTVTDRQTAFRHWLTDREFQEVDAGVYYVHEEP